ncbi:NACHT domain-containing protein [Methanobrevibacter woesei]|uniref:NACHT domain-containing protein n=1 Tax=Methanobrevibacter woesei TaxID=190976 RepID=UPI002354E635|nr:ATP-binding protein [Methanobrevibacter woesei]
MIDWNKLYDYNNYKFKSFEYFCFCIAKRQFDEKGNFTSIDGSGGDGGIEFYLKLNNGDYWGWQAKFFDNPPRLNRSGRKNQIMNSLISSCKNYPKLKKWFLCTNSDFTDTEIDWYENEIKSNVRRIKKYKDLPDVEKEHVDNVLENLELIHWGEGDFNHYCSLPENQGILNYFFGEFEINMDWFNDKFDLFKTTDIEFLKELYVENNVNDDINTILIQEDSLNLFNDFINELDSFSIDSEKIILKDDSKKEIMEDLLNEYMNIHNIIIEDLKNILKFFRNMDLNKIDVSDTKNNLIKLNEITSEFKDFENEYIHDESEDNGYSAFYKMDNHNFWIKLAISNIQSLLSHNLNIIGDAAVGKTFTVSNLAHDLLNNNKPCLIIKGNKFHDTPIGKQFLEILDIHDLNFNQFLDALQVFAEIKEVKLPIIIDALNESVDNFSFSQVWKNNFESLVKQIEKYPNLVLITTCRKSYAEYMDNEIYLENSSYLHYEIEDMDELVDKYFEYYKINVLNSTNSYKYYFKKPIYLKLFCEVHNPYREDFMDVEIKKDDIYNVFETYMAICNKHICESLNIPKRDIVKKSLLKVAKQLWDTKDRKIDINDFYTLIDEKTNETLDKSKAYKIISESLLIKKEYENKEQVYFTYDLFIGYLIAVYLFDKHKNNLMEFFSENQTLDWLYSEDYTLLHPLSEDIKFSLAILINSENGTCLHELSNNTEIIKSSIMSLFSISSEKIDENCIEFVKSFFIENPLDNFWIMAFRENIIEDNHPLNCLFFSDILLSQSIVNRDLSWTEFLKKQYRNLLKNDLESFENSLVSNDVDLNRLNLFARYIMWFLTSTSREIRDKSTRALYNYGCNHPEDFFELLEYSFKINDLYISERMFAVAYGITMALQNNFENNDFVENILPIWAKKIYGLFFDENRPIFTTHLLIVYYASNILKIDSLHDNNLFSKEQTKKFLNPYKNMKTFEWGQSEDKDKGKYRNSADPFESIVHYDYIEKLGKQLSRYHNNDAEYIKEKSHVLWRLYNMGYSYETFKEIDEKIEEDNYRASYNNYFLIHDTYGRKYAKIAALERAGYNVNRGYLVLERDGNFGHFVDIDPSFPKINDYQLLPKLFINPKKEDCDWLDENDFNFENYLIFDKIKDESGSWILMNGFYSAEEDFQSVYTFFRGFFINKDDENEIRKLSENIDYLDNDRLPELNSFYYMYSGEIPWSDDFEKEDEKLFLKDYEENNDEECSYKEFWILTPVNRDCWEDYHSSVNDGLSTYVLSKELSDYFDLVNQPQTFDLFDKNNQKAFISLENTNKTENFEVQQNFAFLRKDLFEDYLSNKNLTFVWIMIAAKKILEEENDFHFIKEFKSFNEIIFYEDL